MRPGAHRRENTAGDYKKSGSVGDPQIVEGHDTRGSERVENDEKVNVHDNDDDHNIKTNPASSGTLILSGHSRRRRQRLPRRRAIVSRARV